MFQIQKERLTNWNMDKNNLKKQLSHNIRQ